MDWKPNWHSGFSRTVGQAVGTYCFSTHPPVGLWNQIPKRNEVNAILAYETCFQHASRIWSYHCVIGKGRIPISSIPVRLRNKTVSESLSPTKPYRKSIGDDQTDSSFCFVRFWTMMLNLWFLEELHAIPVQRTEYQYGVWFWIYWVMSVG